MVEGVPETVDTNNNGTEALTLLFLVDVQNLFYSARNAFGSDARVDFKKIKDEAINGRKFGRIISKAYFAVRPGDAPDDFIAALLRLSYDVNLVQMRSHEQGGASATNIDVMLAVDAMDTKIAGQSPSVIVVASGDSDFMPVYKALLRRGVRIEVLSFPASLSSTVQETVDEVRHLDSRHLFESFVDARRSDLDEDSRGNR